MLFLCKNIFLPLQCIGFSRALRNHGIQTFEDVFGLDENWDETNSETKRIELFISALKKINNLSLEEVKEIYNKEDIQKRINNNYRIYKNYYNFYYILFRNYPQNDVYYSLSNHFSILSYHISQLITFCLFLSAINTEFVYS